MPDELRDRLDRTGPDLRHLAARVRVLIDAVVVGEAPADALRRAATAVDEALAALAPHVPATRPFRYPRLGGLPSPNDLMPFDAVIGRLNPIAPPVEFTFADGKAIGRARLGAPYEGPPGCVHGGVLAAIFDQTLNVPNIMTGTAGPTAKLSLKFRKPTPLDVELRFEGWQERVEGRRVHARGRCLAGDVVTVEAEAVFVQVGVDAVLRLLDPEE